VKLTSRPDFPIRAVEDHHVDRLRVEEPQGLKLSSTNRSIGLITIFNITRSDENAKRAISQDYQCFSLLSVSPTRWLWRRVCTRSHSELGSENLLRRWYFDSSHGRVGRCRVCQADNRIHDVAPSALVTASAFAGAFLLVDAGWSSPPAALAQQTKSFRVAIAVRLGWLTRDGAAR
jgi:hypothetical protein